MYILNYRCDSGYEPTDDQKFGEWRTKKTKILKEYERVFS